MDKHIAKNSIALFVRMFFIILMGLVLSRELLKNLGESDFGIYSVIGGIVTLVGFLNTVMASATNRFMMIELGKKENGDLSKIFSVTIIIHILLGLLIILIGETLGLFYVKNYLNVPPESFAQAKLLYQLSLGASAICVLQIPFQALLITYENFTRFSLVQVYIVALMLISAYLIELFDSNRLVYWGIFLALSQVMGLVGYFFFAKKYYPGFRFVREKAIYKEIRSYSGWVAVGAAAFIGKTQGSNVVLNYFFNTTVNTSFGIASQVNTQLSNFSQNISKAFSPQIMKTYASGEVQKHISLICTSSKYSFFMVYLVALPLILETNFILTLWLGSFPAYTIQFCNLIVVAVLLDKCNDGITSAVLASGKIKWFQIILSSISLFTLPLTCLLFFIGYPPLAISVVFIITGVINVALRQILLKRILGFSISLFVKKIYLRCLAVVIFTLPLLFILRNYMHEGWSRFVILTVLSCSCNLLMIYFVGMEVSEKAKVKEFIIRKIKK